MINRERILRTAPGPEDQEPITLVEAFLTEDEKESIDAILGALARRQHPLGERVYKARHYAREAIFIYINQLSSYDLQNHMEDFRRDHRGRSRSPRTIAHLASSS